MKKCKGQRKIKSEMRYRKRNKGYEQNKDVEKED